MPKLEWIGKKAVVKHHREVPLRLLEPVEELGCGENGGADSGNLIVEGDNLHALKALLPRYAGKVKCIYIDPPYNTGNENWVYNDNVNSPEIKKWLGETVGKEAEDLTRHDKWLCMMYPRLVLLRQFLREDGVIFVSHDDNETATLNLILTEIFGKNQHVATFVWNSLGHTDNQLEVKINHEYISCYSRNRKKVLFSKNIDPNTREESNLWENVAINSITKNGQGNPPSKIKLPKGFPSNSNSFRLSKTVIPKGLIEWMEKEKPSTSTIKRKHQAFQFPVRYNDMAVEKSVLSEPCEVYSGWANARKLRLFISNNFEPLIEEDGSLMRFYLTENGVIYYEKKKPTANNVLSVLRNFGTTETMRSELEDMGINFTYPKPKKLIQYLVGFATKKTKNDIILDSFSGSGTTGHAVLKQNAEDGGKRKFILVEMDKDISRNITSERIRRVSKGYEKKKGNSTEKVEGLGGGFQYCKLSDEPLFDKMGEIREDVSFEQLAEFVWFQETGTAFNGRKEKLNSPLLGVFQERAIYLLYNGILKDKSVQGGNVLTYKVLENLPDFGGQRVIYGAGCRFQEKRLQAENIVFRQTPYALHFNE